MGSDADQPNVARPLQVQRAPDKPVMIYDGECRFCCYWIRRWQQVTGDAVVYVAQQDPSVSEQFSEILPADLAKAVHLVDPDGRVWRGAEAVYRSLAHNPHWRWPLKLYQSVPGIAPVSEAAYQFVAKHRTSFSIITRLLWGVHAEPPSYRLVQELFLRGLGLIYLIAFVSLWIQVSGLFGAQGVLPADQYMSAARQYFDHQGIGWERYHLVPTLFWVGAGTGVLQAVCFLGVLTSTCLMLGIAPASCAFLLWVFYLSLVTVGRDFLSFQWDALLLESGFVALLLAPMRWGWASAIAGPESRLGLGLLRWLLFRLMFESGCVKLLSGDPSWRYLTALKFHYETQPLPTWLAWYAHHWPSGFNRACVGVILGIELGLPFLVFAPRRLRFAAAAGFILLQVCILLTGNYGFFNYLTILLCVTLLDDRAVRRFATLLWPKPGRALINPASDWSNSESGPDRRSKLLLSAWRRWIAPAVAIVVAVVSLAQLCGMFGWRLPGNGLVVSVANWIAPFRTVNSYGLFAVMTVSRPEIIVEGSNDAKNWLPYEFKYKPGDLRRRPPFVAPYQPRLDWQMWFAALGTYPQNPWFVSFCYRLLQGRTPVLKLLERNPFPNSPPKFVRAVLYNYHFTNPGARDPRAWWTRERAGLYFPPMSLESVPPGMWQTP